MVVYSDQIVQFVPIIRGLTPILLECTLQFVQRGDLRNEGTLAAFEGFAKSIAGNITSNRANLEAMNSNVRANAASFMGITHDLTTSCLRVNSVMGQLYAGFEDYLSAQEQIRSLVERKIEDGKKNLAQASV
jgi:hypothetical protein